MPPGTLKTYTPDGVVGIVEPWTLGLTSRTPSVVTSFLLSATNTITPKVGSMDETLSSWFSPKCLKHLIGTADQGQVK